jgi:hypothetical protein
MYLRSTRRRYQDGSSMEYSQATETCWDPTRRRPTAHVIHNFCRTETLDREALLQLPRSISRLSHAAIEVPTDVALPDEVIERE